MEKIKTDAEWEEFLNQIHRCEVCGIEWNACLDDHICPAEIKIDRFIENLKAVWKDNPKYSFGRLVLDIMFEDCDYHDFYNGSDEAFLERIVEFRGRSAPTK